MERCLGGMGVLWVVGWLFLTYESPRVHPRINKTELDYIQNSLAETGVTEREVSDSHNVFSGSKHAMLLNLLVMKVENKCAPKNV